MFSKTVIAAVFAAVVAAQQNPTTAPATGEVVPGCKPYTLKWNPVSAGTVSIEIISGATQGTQVPVGKIATGIPNTGSFVWTPEASLGANAFTGYKIYNDGSATGEFTYSVPFKIDAASCAQPTTSSSSSAAPTETPSEYPTASASASATETESMSYPTETPVIPSASSSLCTTTSTVYMTAPSPSAPAATYPAETPVAPYPTGPAGTGAPYPSGTGVPTTLSPSGTGAGPVPYPSATPPAQEFPGAASGVKAGLGLAGAAAAFILML